MSSLWTEKYLLCDILIRKKREKLLIHLMNIYKRCIYNEIK